MWKAKKPDPDIWNKKTILTVSVVFIIAINIDLYGSALTFWMSLHEMSSFMEKAVMITIACVEVIGWATSGLLVDRYGTKKVQLVSLWFLLTTGLFATTLEGRSFLYCLLLRFLICAMALVANTIQLRDMLPKEKQEKYPQLFLVALVGGVAGASVGSWLAGEHEAVWKWIGPILTIVGIAALMHTQPPNRAPKKVSLRPHPEVFKLIVPVTTIVIIQFVLIAYVVKDLGPRDGAAVRVMMYVGNGLAGWVVPFILSYTDRKKFIRFGVIIASVALLCLYWPNLTGLITASLVIGIIFSGIQTCILETKVYLLTEDQRGRATATSRLVQGGSRIVGIIGLGMVRDHVGDAVYLFLPLVLLLSLPVFEWTFRRSPWK